VDGTSGIEALASTWCTKAVSDKSMSLVATFWPRKKIVGRQVALSGSKSWLPFSSYQCVKLHADDATVAGRHEPGRPGTRRTHP
jgi:hypothetical protein